VADPGRRLVEGVKQVGDVRGDVPRLVPRGVPVASEVCGDDAKAASEALLGQLAEAQPVAGDSMQADDERRVRVSPLVGVQPQSQSSLGV